MFIDKNGDELQVGDYIVPDEGLELVIVEEKYMDEWGEVCLIATQLIHPDVYSILPQDNLSTRWSKVSPDDVNKFKTIQNSSPIIVEEGNDIICENHESELLMVNEEANRESRERGKLHGK